MRRRPTGPYTMVAVNSVQIEAQEVPVEVPPALAQFYTAEEWALARDRLVASRARRAREGDALRSRLGRVLFHSPYEQFGRSHP